MHKTFTLVNWCVKTVNNLRTVDCVNGVNSSTFGTTLFSLCRLGSAQTKLITNAIQPISTNFYTTLNRIFNLMNKTFTHNPQPLLMSPLREN